MASNGMVTTTIRGLVCMAALALVGCASAPVSPDQAQPLGADRLLAYKAPQGQAGGILSVTRDAGFKGGGCLAGFYINGQLAARFAVGEQAVFHVPAGEVLLKLSSDPQGRGLCSLAAGNFTQRETTLKAGETKQFRLMITADGTLDIQRATP